MKSLFTSPIKDNIEQYEQEGSPVKSQLGIAYTDFIQRDEANFKDYEAFLQYVNKKGSYIQ